ncbi:hypothetical protein N7509_004881 [Penicillium cosmopolitanum]|uniref:Uncharacterized protein n=1 Tax=Penicillium cosmopolitanum TaxID=1131564 RepID=A0A9X0B9I8_9EURO|nr:uncharacterized protein N7509_004881 [Penicillium cosmopolitanum]KAJ5396768.1 hypothetical protein N7509_004881 [Penicillium cosmopolitanum]
MAPNGPDGERKPQDARRPKIKDAQKPKGGVVNREPRSECSGYGERGCKEREKQEGDRAREI